MEFSHFGNAASVTKFVPHETKQMIERKSEGAAYRGRERRAVGDYRFRGVFSMKGICNVITLKIRV